jgi:hypothetical protein
LRHRRRRCGHDGLLCFFLQTKERLRHASLAVSRRARAALPKPRQFSFFS